MRRRKWKGRRHCISSKALLYHFDRIAAFGKNSDFCRGLQTQKIWEKIIAVLSKNARYTLPVVWLKWYSTLWLDTVAVWVNPNLIMVKELDLQLEWHRVHRGQKILKSSSKQEKLERWYKAVTEYLKGTTVPVSKSRGGVEQRIMSLINYLLIALRLMREQGNIWYRDQLCQYVYLFSIMDSTHLYTLQHWWLCWEPQ